MCGDGTIVMSYDSQLTASNGQVVGNATHENPAWIDKNGDLLQKEFNTVYRYEHVRYWSGQKILAYFWCF